MEIARAARYYVYISGGEPLGNRHTGLSAVAVDRLLPAPLHEGKVANAADRSNRHLGGNRCYF